MHNNSSVEIPLHKVRWPKLQTDGAQTHSAERALQRGVYNLTEPDKQPKLKRQDEALAMNAEKAQAFAGPTSSLGPRQMMPSLRHSKRHPCTQIAKSCLTQPKLESILHNSMVKLSIFFFLIIVFL